MDRERYRDGFEFSNTQRTLPILLLRAREAVMDRFRPILNAHDITEQQWRVIRILHERGQTDSSQLAVLACVLPPSLTRMLKALEARGMVEVCKDPSDARRNLVRLSPKGDVFIASVSPSSAKVYEEIEARIGRERISHIMDELQALLDALDSAR
ncbi:homoprotocatechuate degradation operon regulator HpaR [Mangrovicoccus ximenensis]|uniref:homoprotocatechuate degradation operon regulator HpaR n=1 Tax=Mangrovicoccus ximenensis TaxID=1911570 RepID=UPI000D3520FE|nr:homoprotocatechuate degradation operon regulator HpaR [Mangrovicoccus ximenensis]